MANSPDSYQVHQASGARHGPLGFAVITLSDTRTEAVDTSGRFIRDAVAATGHFVARYAILKEDPAAILSVLQEALAHDQVSVVVTNGGTGIAVRDSAYEVVSSLLDKTLDGFGEIFRMLSYEEIGAAAMMSRAIAGIVGRKVVFSLPGSTKAVKLGMEKLVLPQAGHLWYELHKHE